MMNDTIGYELNGINNFKVGGYATGRYNFQCHICKHFFLGDKRAWLCLKCVDLEMAICFIQKEKLVKAIKYFVKRVEAGTIRSVKTYKYYKDLLSEITAENRNDSRET